jgi:hypothetical protein
MSVNSNNVMMNIAGILVNNVAMKSISSDSMGMSNAS